jgi:hypothetical protein
VSKISLVAAATALFLAFVGTAASIPGVDQQQPTLDNTMSLGVGGSAGRKLAQVVTPAIAGTLTEVQLPARCQPGSQLVLEIRNAAGSPGSTVLASQTATVPVSGRNFHPITLANPPFIAAEDDFAFALSSPGSCDVFPGPANTDSYPRGGAFSEAIGGSWVPYSADLAFKTFVEPRCGVPDVVGMPEASARTEVTRSGCAFGRVARAYSKRVRRGSVLSQSPTEGVLDPGTAVALVISLGPRPCAVPRLRGKTLRQARTALTRANCRLGKVSRRVARGTRPGRVVGQRPAAGVRRPAGTRVHIVLSR